MRIGAVPSIKPEQPTAYLFGGVTVALVEYTVQDRLRDGDSQHSCSDGLSVVNPIQSSVLGRPAQKHTHLIS